MVSWGIADAGVEHLLELNNFGLSHTELRNAIKWLVSPKVERNDSADGAYKAHQYQKGVRGDTRHLDVGR